MKPTQEKVPRNRKDARQCQTDAPNSVQGNFTDQNKDKPKKSNDKKPHDEPQNSNGLPGSSEVNKKKRKKKDEDSCGTSNKKSQLQIYCEMRS